METRSKLGRIIAPALSASPTVGGQAVMEGVMMRNLDKLAVAVRKPSGEIYVETWPWFSLVAKAPFLKRPFLRGFPVLVETLVNGVKALNFSAEQALDDGEEGEEMKPWHLALTLVLSIAMALGLFVVIPHLLSMGMEYLGVGGDMEGLSFHIWDGFYKLAMFLGYIVVISFIPDIRRVFQYHGAEHKVIWAYEKHGTLEPGKAAFESRLHPRCGTAFLLFVLSISIVLHTILVPAFLYFYTPESVILKHVYIVVFKLMLVAPISALAYELIKFAGKNQHSLFCKILSGPGLILQMLTTHEPNTEQVEVALAALKSALAEGEPAQADVAAKTLSGNEAESAA